MKLFKCGHHIIVAKNNKDCGKVMREEWGVVLPFSRLRGKVIVQDYPESQPYRVLQAEAIKLWKRGIAPSY